MPQSIDSDHQHSTFSQTLKVGNNDMRGLHFKVAFIDLTGFLIFNGIAEMKFAILAFLYCGEIVKYPIDGATFLDVSKTEIDNH